MKETVNTYDMTTSDYESINPNHWEKNNEIPYPTRYRIHLFNNISNAQDIAELAALIRVKLNELTLSQEGPSSQYFFKPNNEQDENLLTEVTTHP